MQLHAAVHLCLFCLEQLGHSPNAQHGCCEDDGSRKVAALDTLLWRVQSLQLASLLPQAKSDEGYCVVSVRAGEGGPGTPFGFLPNTDYNLARGPQQQHQLAPGSWGGGLSTWSVAVLEPPAWG